MISDKEKPGLDLLIISPKMLMSYKSVVPNGPLSIASYLDQKGFKVRVVIDNSQYKKFSDKEMSRLIGIYRPRVVGLSLNILNALGGYNLLDRIRADHPGLVVIAGGLYTFTHAEEMVKKGFDLVFQGEAEKSLTAFMDLAVGTSLDSHGIRDDGQFLGRLKEIPGILINSREGVLNTGPPEMIQDLDELPFQNYELMNLDDFIKVRSDHYGVTNSLNFQRGCPFNCTYCKSRFMAGRVRQNSAAFIVEQLAILHKKYGMEQFNLVDANFPLDRRRMREFCRLMTDSGWANELRIWCQNSVTVPLEEEDLDLLKKAGVVVMSVGVERLSDDFRRLMRKKGSGAQAAEALKRIHSAGIRTMANILINFPQDDGSTLAAEADLLEDLLPYINYYGTNYLVPLPGTEIYDPQAEYAGWYLRPEIYHKPISYYDIAYDVTTPGLEFNIFGHDRDTVRAMRRFKERLYKRSILLMNRSLWFRLALAWDLLLARFSLLLYRISPRLENLLMALPKQLRVLGFKYAMDRVIMGRGRQADDSAA